MNLRFGMPSLIAAGFAERAYITWSPGMVWDVRSGSYQHADGFAGLHLPAIQQADANIGCGNVLKNLSLPQLQGPAADAGTKGAGEMPARRELGLQAAVSGAPQCIDGSCAERIHHQSIERLTGL